MKKKTKLILLEALLLGLILFVAFLIGRILFERYSEKRTYEWLKEEAQEVLPDSDYDTAFKLNPTEESANENTKEPSGSFDFLDENLSRKIDFETLQKINSDIVAWIYIPDTVIDYPILQAKDPNPEDYYLRRNFEEKSAKSGSIFMRKDAESRLRLDVNLLFGHNMKSGGMFASLHKYLKSDFFFSHKSIYIYTPKETIEYEVFSSNIRSPEMITEMFSDISALLFDVRNTAEIFDDSVDISKNRILGLYTCTNGNNRVCVFAIEKKRLDISVL